MKLHPLLIKAAADALTEIFERGKYADKVIERMLKSNPKWGSRDRAFLAETTYECVRWWRLYRHLCLESEVSATNAHNWIGVHWVLKSEQNLEAFKQLNYDTLKAAFDKITDRKIKNAIPDWLDSVAETELGTDKWLKELETINRPADVVLRCNVLKTSVLDLQKKLSEIGWETQTTPLSKDALVLKKRGNIFQTDLFKNGFFEVQDAGSQTIAPFLQVESGMRVVDACAGAGGKSLHLANLMGNKGRIISMDTEGWKLEELQRRARRNGVFNIETRLIDTTKVIKRLHDSADRVLLDVPCSGLGTLRRNPDAKWKLQPEFLTEIRTTQAHILENYAKMVKVGGKMVYATCSLLPSENEAQVKVFLEKNKNFKWLDERTISPATEGFDGFYMALLERV
ncbi:MAG: methyltransferase domain-containing protein [Saprospiraceae bacterium]|nr:methyltransferase domain-containing protein [Saprospiraceae bacterium]